MIPFETRALIENFCRERGLRVDDLSHVSSEKARQTLHTVVRILHCGAVSFRHISEFLDIPFATIEAILAPPKSKIRDKRTFQIASVMQEEIFSHERRGRR